VQTSAGYGLLPGADLLRSPQGLRAGRVLQLNKKEAEQFCLPSGNQQKAWSNQDSGPTEDGWAAVFLGLNAKINPPAYPSPL
jgi:hypothetical protein